ncbi:MAG TPA: ADP-ribosylglycohydrolase family protein [Armatimonadota bacterium]|nr:ADP-ribosylglycohydrolase family protein [Armatimonadota bacterium]
MPYFGDMIKDVEELQLWMDLAKEQGADLEPVEAEVRQFIKEMQKKVQKLQPKPDYPYEEPDSLDEIKALRPDGPRKIPLSLTEEDLYDKILGAWLGRSAGCVLGVPIEGRDRWFIESWAKKLGQPYPLNEYWADYPDVSRIHYSEPVDCHIKGKIDHVAPDDDLAYTVLGLLILEEYGPNFTSENVGQAWVKYLPMACTAEHVALENLKKGLIPPRTALVDNPYTEWIGADIRSDPWGYAAPGWPELVAEFAYRDACVSHTKNGIYGEMFFSAAIAAAFAVQNPLEALLIGLTEIPAKSRMAETVTETIDWVNKDKDWDKTWHRIDEKYRGMHVVHTLNNAALTIAALLYSDGDFERSIALAVMGGLDTDCTAATTGSIMGAILGAKNLPARWIEPFNDRLTTYLIGHEEHKVSDLARRTIKVARLVESVKCKAQS